MKEKPSLSRGMRDFTPKQFAKRDYIVSIIKEVYQKYGFEKIETPVIEQLSVLLGKYGTEGDKLVFKVLNSGDYLSDAPDELLSQKDSQKLAPYITEKGLRYDLTVPLARYVVMNRNELVFPFKRYHIDKVWRADRPQKGRYREFYQCDGDVIGSESLLYDAQFVFIFDEVLSRLNIPPFTIKLNNRKILLGLAEQFGFSDKFIDFTVAIDKLDKISEEGVIRELGNKGFSESQIHIIQQLLRLEGDNMDKLSVIASWFQDTETGRIGVEELKQVLSYMPAYTFKNGKVSLDFTLARGLDYYTGTIYEVTIDNYNMGSICGGGRYDNLTESFGVPDMPGIGVSFGLERVYDVLEAEGLFPETISPSHTQALIINFGGEDEIEALSLCQKLLNKGISCEVYPSAHKLAKQFQYAERKEIPKVLIYGGQEREKKMVIVKNLLLKTQEEIHIDSLSELFG